ncbi:MAG: hypothetical protein R2856_36145 [Caldilineaceae bacterium]
MGSTSAMACAAHVSAGAFRPTQPFLARDGVGVDTQRFDVDGDRAAGLRAVHHDQRAVTVGDLGDLGHRQDRACLPRNVRDGNQARLVCDGAFRSVRAAPRRCLRAASARAHRQPEALRHGVDGHQPAGCSSASVTISSPPASAAPTWRCSCRWWCAA